MKGTFEYFLGSEKIIANLLGGDRLPQLAASMAS